jgi:solute carrier family 25 carnitine/acylcarnitine transporter 20/29
MPVSEAYIDFIAGWASGAVSTLIIQPVDTVLTRLQAGDRLLAATTNATTSAATATATATATASSAGNGQAVANTSVRVQLRGLLESYGVSSLWRGSSAMISAVPMQNCLLMGGYGVGKQWAEAGDLDQSSTLLSVFVGGCTGGLIQSFFMSPVELIKVNQQVHGRAIAAGGGGGVGGGGGSSASVKAASLELWRGLFVTMGNTSKSASSSWRGLNATLLRDGIPHGVWFASYEWCKTTLTKNLVLVVADGGKEESSTTTTTTTTETVAIPIVSGAFAATVAWVRC